MEYVKLSAQTIIVILVTNFPVEMLRVRRLVEEIANGGYTEVYRI